MPELKITRLENVSNETIAIEVETPDGFEAYPGQFVLVRATINGEEEAGYYTISSSNVDDTFEITIEVDPDGTLGPWLAERTLNERLAIEGPFGDIQYKGDTNAFVVAGGPGIGPAVGIAERAQETGSDVTIVYDGEAPAHGDRLTELKNYGATIVLSDDLSATLTTHKPSNANIYAFGFQSFIEKAKDALSDSNIDFQNVEIENFGPA